MKETKKLWWGLVLLILISPLGLALPELFKSGPAWGEWSLKEIDKMLGSIPAGIEKLSHFWSAPVPDYNLKAWEGEGLARRRRQLAQHRPPQPQPHRQHLYHPESDRQSGSSVANRSL